MASNNRTPRSVLDAPKQTVTPVEVDRMPFLNRRADKAARRVAAKIRSRQETEARRQTQDANTVLNRRRAAAGELPGATDALRDSVRRDLDRIAALK